MEVITVRLIERGEIGDLATLGRHPAKPRADGAKDDRALRRPHAEAEPAAVDLLDQCHGVAAREGYLLEFAGLGEVADPLAIGRKKRLTCTEGAGQVAHRQRVE